MCRCVHSNENENGTDWHRFKAKYPNQLWQMLRNSINSIPYTRTITTTYTLSKSIAKNPVKLRAICIVRSKARKNWNDDDDDDNDEEHVKDEKRFPVSGTFLLALLLCMQPLFILGAWFLCVCVFTSGGKQYIHLCACLPYSIITFNITAMNGKI